MREYKFNYFCYELNIHFKKNILIKRASSVSSIFAFHPFDNRNIKYAGNGIEKLCRLFIILK